MGCASLSAFCITLLRVIAGRTEDQLWLANRCSMESRTLSDICSVSDLDRAALQKILVQHLGNKDIDVKNIPELEEVSGNNDFYNSEIKNLTVQYSKDDDDERVLEAHMVVKTPVTPRFMRHVQKIGRPFMKEYLWYVRIQPSLAKHCPAIGSISPACYYAYSNYADDIYPTTCNKLCYVSRMASKTEKGLILLENLTKKSDGAYEHLDKNLVPDFDTVRVVMEATGHYHGAWWKFLNDSGTIFHDSSITKADVLAAFKASMPKWILQDMFSQSFKSAAQLLANQGESPDLIQRIKVYGRTKAMNDLDYMLGQTDKDSSQLKTICHGDLWLNNMLFKKINGKVSSVKIIDYQMLELVHPARDLCYFLYTCTDRTFRDKYLDLCLRSYYATFSSYFHSSFEMTFEEFEKEFQKRRVIGLLWGLLVMPNVLSPRKLNLQTFKEMRDSTRHRHEDIAGEESEDDPPMIREIRKRIVEMIHEFRELQLI